MCERRYTPEVIAELQRPKEETCLVYIVEGGDELFDAVAHYIQSQPVTERLLWTLRLNRRLSESGVYMGECYAEALLHD